jgi:hypothetical protein
VNVSPKGLDSLCVLGPTTVEYLDLTWSGIETASHEKEKGRTVLCSARFRVRLKYFVCTGAAKSWNKDKKNFAKWLSAFPNTRVLGPYLGRGLSRIGILP